MLAIALSIASCKKKEGTHTETKPMGKYNVVITYKKDMPIRSISYDKRTNKKIGYALNNIYTLDSIK